MILKLLRLRSNSLYLCHMTRLIAAAIILLTAIVFLSACAAPKYGCPSNPMGNSKFRG
ncbi:MAG: hypothetical protein RLZZ256_1194 [Bacteroidota bacterium]